MKDIVNVVLLGLVTMVIGCLMPKGHGQALVSVTAGAMFAVAIIGAINLWKPRH